MNHNINVKNGTLQTFVANVNNLGVELVIDQALRNVRKEKLTELIDQALVNKDEEAFNRYTEEYNQLEDVLIG
ncbi:IDEAL domain-containing protein [Staphylococcus carnosus]|uniref:IDEAL domain protein n=1 Tax=Staphylococcus carnosus TaxID=1281 RepID=A0AAJ0JNT0_STACA|nr:IDEAL domain-containing protein [Staphylococcus carnosus]KKB24955.1 IDEAL domain protein [Staphylococcus carnosus]POA04208.1 IDEAL domain-containing protein [Staphylococcus carnosus]QQS85688.1 IDEAL domain-containing protein [Staphylococcus carnosus]QRQ05625.1 IDEAL domain-containing protein [Staphylococcus carnosus]UTB84094.1 IDEAL domain protein [Staphylococcus carnosus]